MNIEQIGVATYCIKTSIEDVFTNDEIKWLQNILENKDITLTEPQHNKLHRLLDRIVDDLGWDNHATY